MTRETPNPQITMRIAPQANPVDTMIMPERYTDFGANKTKAALQTADELKNFVNSATTANNVLMDQAETTAQKEYLDNKSNWKQFSNEHPFLSHLNPHVQDSFAKIKANEEMTPIISDFQTKIEQRPDMSQEDFQNLLNQTKQGMYQSAAKNGVTYYDIEKEILPKINQVEQNSVASYTSNHAKYQYETTKLGFQSDLQKAAKTHDNKFEYKGNIDIYNRPLVKNTDGSISTVRSVSFTIDDGANKGKTVILPTVSDDGKIISDKQAYDNFKKDGRHLGMYDTVDEAEKAAQDLHNQQAVYYGLQPPDPSSMQSVIDSYSSVLNPLDTADSVYKMTVAEFNAETQNMSFDPKAFASSVKQLKINGKPISDIDMEVVGKINEAVDGFYGRRNSVQAAIQQQEEWQQKMNYKALTDDTINSLNGATPEQAKSIISGAMQKAKDMKLGGFTLDLMNDMYSYNRIKNGLDKGANENNLNTLSAYIDQSTAGKLDRVSLIKDVKNNLITQETAEGLMSRDSSSKEQNTKENKNKFINKSINNYFTKDRYLTEVTRATGLSKDMLYAMYPQQVADGYVSWMNNYNMLANQSISSGDTTNIQKELSTNVNEIKAQIDTQNKATSQEHKSNNKGKGWWDMVFGGSAPNKSSSNGFIMPVKQGRITQSAAQHISREGAGNEAIDIVGHAGSAVMMPANGKLVKYAMDPKSGTYALISFNNGLTMTISHLDPNTIYRDYEGKSLSQGSPIGVMGSSGYTLGLNKGQGIAHIVIRENGKRIDPMKYLSNAGALL